MVTETGEQHGMINSVGNSVRDDGFQHMKADIKGKAEKKKKEMARIVKAKYLNSRGMNERLDKQYCAGGGEPIQQWHCIPGYTYDIPLGLVEEVNNNPGLPRRSEVLDVNNNPTKRDGVTEKIHQFVSVNF